MQCPQLLLHIYQIFKIPMSLRSLHPKDVSLMEVNHCPPQSPTPPRKEYDSDDDFDSRFGHLINLSPDANNNYDSDQPDSPDHSELPNHEEEESGQQEDSNAQDHSDGEESTDEALVEITAKVPNWEHSAKLKKFIASCINRPMPEEMLKHLSEEFVPSPDTQDFFIPPKMPNRLYNAITRMKTKSALKTEKAMYNAQKELFIMTKPLIAALNELKPLGEPVSKAREKLSITLQGLYSTSLKISKARRENVRFLFKFQLAEVLYGFQPNHISLFGGTSFSSQIEISAKEAKLDFSWAKTSSKPKQSYMPFRKYGQQGFQNKGYGKSFNRRPYPNNNYQQKNSNFNNNKQNKSKNTKGSSYQGKQQ